MLSVLAAVLPLAGAILAGAALARWRGLGDGAVAALNTYVVWLALPALLFDFIAEADWAALNQPRFALVFGLAAFGIFAAALAVPGSAQTLSRRALDALTASYANTAYLGIPLASALLGQAGLAAAVIASLLTVCALFAVAVTLVEIDRGRQGTRASWAGATRRILARVAANPIVAAPVAGALWAAGGVTMPAPAAALLRMLAGSTTPVALVTIGMFLAQPRARTAPHELAMVLALKLVGQPLLVLALLVVLPLDRTHAAAALLLAALPTGTGPFMAAQLYGEEVGLAARATLVGTLASIASVSLIAWWLT